MLQLFKVCKETEEVSKMMQPESTANAATTKQKPKAIPIAVTFKFSPTNAELTYTFNLVLTKVDKLPELKDFVDDMFIDYICDSTEDKSIAYCLYVDDAQWNNISDEVHSTLLAALAEIESNWQYQIYTIAKLYAASIANGILKKILAGQYTKETLQQLYNKGISAVIDAEQTINALRAEKFVKAFLASRDKWYPNEEFSINNPAELVQLMAKAIKLAEKGKKWRGICSALGYKVEPVD